MKIMTIKLLLVALFFYFLNCEQKKSLTHKELEKAAFYQVFPSLIDSIHYDVRLMKPPPPPPTYTDENGFEIKIDSQTLKKIHHNAIEEWEKKKNIVLNDTSSVYLKISDSINFYENEDSHYLMKHYRNREVVLSSCNFDSLGYRIDIKKLMTNQKKLKFIYLSESSKNTNSLNKDRVNIAASLSFTRILFDKTKQLGVFNVSYVIARLDGVGYRVFIKKNKNSDWVIDKIEGTWIS